MSDGYGIVRLFAVFSGFIALFFNTWRLGRDVCGLMGEIYDQASPSTLENTLFQVIVSLVSMANRIHVAVLGFFVFYRTTLMLAYGISVSTGQEFVLEYHLFYIIAGVVVTDILLSLLFDRSQVAGASVLGASVVSTFVASVALSVLDAGSAAHFVVIAVSFALPMGTAWYFTVHEPIPTRLVALAGKQEKLMWHRMAYASSATCIVMGITEMAVFGEDSSGQDAMSRPIPLHAIFICAAAIAILLILFKLSSDLVESRVRRKVLRRIVLVRPSSEEDRGQKAAATYTIDGDEEDEDKQELLHAPIAAAAATDTVLPNGTRISAVGTGTKGEEAEMTTLAHTGTG